MLCKALPSLLLGAALLPSLVAAQQTTPPAPEPLREFRGAWVATVDNIDWPSKPGLGVAQLKREAIALLDRIAELNMNAVIFQVRPQADALYPSKLEPWSYYLSGRQGKAPAGGFDPLRFWIEEAHARGLELHAWFNPYRASHPAHKGPLHPSSIVRSHPKLVHKLGNKGYYWMDPAYGAVQDHSAAVVMDVVRRYDIDGVHFDDYFYPYSSYNNGKDFPDNASYAAYRKGGGKLARKDFRRAAVNGFIKRLYREIHQAKPRVKFGISPFGIWRPGHPRGIAGMDQYDKLYADARLWLHKGWVDYLMPQLYWPISQVPQSYPVLLGWWKRQNLQDRQLWPGIMPRGGPGDASAAKELLGQIMVARGMLPQRPGTCLFSAKRLMGENHHILAAYRKAYRQPALVPATPWLDAKAPAAPRALSMLQSSSGKPSLRWKSKAKDLAGFVLYLRRDKQWSYRILPRQLRSLPLNEGPGDELLLSAFDRCGNESPKARLMH
ncbi:MAG: hypothetical protein CSA62_15300 [Planctomycetota bacterium]|nr:MAG: hypothetical protein CSA62_15300 [Planctomycetota bacterium]